MQPKHQVAEENLWYPPRCVHHLKPLLNHVGMGDASRALFDVFTDLDYRIVATDGRSGRLRGYSHDRCYPRTIQFSLRGVDEQVPVEDVRKFELMSSIHPPYDGKATLG